MPKFPHCFIAFFNGTSSFKIALEWIVFNSILDCIIVAINSVGQGKLTISVGLILRTKVNLKENWC